MSTSRCELGAQLRPPGRPGTPPRTVARSPARTADWRRCALGSPPSRVPSASSGTPERSRKASKACSRGEVSTPPKSLTMAVIEPTGPRLRPAGRGGRPRPRRAPDGGRPASRPSAPSRGTDTRAPRCSASPATRSGGCSSSSLHSSRPTRVARPVAVEVVDSRGSRMRTAASGSTTAAWTLSCSWPLCLRGRRAMTAMASLGPNQAASLAHRIEPGRARPPRAARRVDPGAPG